MILPVSTRTTAASVSPAPPVPTPKRIRHGLFQLLRFGVLLWTLGATVFIFLYPAGNVRLGWRSGPEEDAFGLGRSGYEASYTGWPVICARTERVWPEGTRANTRGEVRRRFDWSAAWLDTLVVGSIFGGTVYVGRYLWPRVAARQFSLATMMRVMVIVGTLSIVLPADLNPLCWLPPYASTSLGNYHALASYPWWIYWPVMYGVVCAIFWLSVFVPGIVKYSIAFIRAARNDS